MTHEDLYKSIPTVDELPRNDRVLVVDDSSTNRFLLQAILKGAGYQVDECVDGRECLEYLEREVPRVILLDIMMPEVDGIEVCKVLRAVYSKDELPIIMVTTRTESEDVALGLEVGANDYVTKPIDRTVLLARLESNLMVSENHAKIEQQKKSLERALKVQSAMGDVLPDAVLIQNSDGLVMYSNDALASACGGAVPARVEDVFDQIFDGCLLEACADAYEKILSDGDYSFDEEIEVVRQSIRNFRMVSRSVNLEDNTRLRVWLWRDLTPIRELQRKVNQQVKLETVGLFAAGVAHNFNNFLGGILGASQLLRRRIGEQEDARRCLKVIEKAVEAGARLTGKMSALSLDGGSEGPDVVVEPLDQVVESVFEVHRALGLEHIQFKNEVAPRTYVRVPYKMLLDIISNLVSNSVDALDGSPHGYIRASVCAAPSAGWIEFRLEDSGRGMDATSLSRVFEPFFSTKNLDEANNVSMEGNGLGLWNVYNLVKSLGGDIRFKSAPNAGTSAVLILPGEILVEAISGTRFAS